MPHKYEREIEEILRNMEQREPQRGGERVRQLSRQPVPPRTRAPARPPLALPSLLVVGIALALVAAGVSFYLQATNVLTGAIALAGLACILFALIIGWSERFVGTRSPHMPRATRMAAHMSEPTPIGMRRRGLFSEVATQVRILRLKMRYWRNPER